MCLRQTLRPFLDLPVSLYDISVIQLRMLQAQVWSAQLFQHLILPIGPNLKLHHLSMYPPKLIMGSFLTVVYKCPEELKISAGNGGTGGKGRF